MTALLIVFLIHSGNNDITSLLHLHWLSCFCVVLSYTILVKWIVREIKKGYSRGDQIWLPIATHRRVKTVYTKLHVHTKRTRTKRRYRKKVQKEGKGMRYRNEIQ